MDGPRLNISMMIATLRQIVEPQSQGVDDIPKLILRHLILNNQAKKSPKNKKDKFPKILNRLKKLEKVKSYHKFVQILLSRQLKTIPIPNPGRGRLILPIKTHQPINLLLQSLMRELNHNRMPEVLSAQLSLSLLKVALQIRNVRT